MLNSARPVHIRPAHAPGLLIGFSNISKKYFRGWPYLKYACHFPRAGKSQNIALPWTLLRVSFKRQSFALNSGWHSVSSWVAPYTKSCSRLLCMEQSWKGQHHLNQVRFLGTNASAECHHAVSPINADDNALKSSVSNRNPVSYLAPRLFSQMVPHIYL